MSPELEVTGKVSYQENFHLIDPFNDLCNEGFPKNIWLSYPWLQKSRKFKTHLEEHAVFEETHRNYPLKKMGNHPSPSETSLSYKKTC